MNKVELLRSLELGAVVAEQDDLLTRCFVRHPVLSEVIYDRKDLVLGAKGSGKSALWKEFTESQSRYEVLHDVTWRLVTNPKGDPEFRDVIAAISAADFPDPEELRVGWRLYFLAQLWKASESLLSKDARRMIGAEIDRYKIIPKGPGLKLAFAYALAKARALKNIDVKWTTGIALDFDQSELRAGGSAAAIPFNDLLSMIDDGLGEMGQRCWLILDRLDEIILGDEDRENQVLKGLLLAFRDVGDLRNARFKIFLRDDVYDRVTELGHFPALTHVRSKATNPIKWELEDLLHLVVRRLLTDEHVVQLLELDTETVQTSEQRRKVFYELFPEKVDKGRAAEGFKWIVDRITDGNGVATPRDLLSVLDAARTIQIEQMEREALELPARQLFTEDTLRKAVRRAAEENLKTRVYAEYPDLREAIKAFAGGKADHNDETLREVLGADWEAVVSRLRRVGFIHRRTRSGVEMWTIPFFYSFAIDATRGAGFDLGSDESEN